MKIKKKNKIKKLKYYKYKSIYHFFKPKKVAPSGMIIKFGNRGTGKSTDIAKYFYKQHKLYEKDKCPYKHFYSNQKISYYQDDFFKYLDLVKYKFTDYIDPEISDVCVSTFNTCKEKPPFTISRSSFIALDEMGIIAQNRDYKNFPKEFTNYVKLLRHFGSYLLCYSQAYDIDKSLRTGANELYLMRKIGNITISWKLKKDIIVSDDTQNADSQIHDSVKFTPWIIPGNIKFTYIPFYTDLFNSFE